MKYFDEINLEEGMPSSQEAIGKLKDAVLYARRGNVGCLLVIHGYGSSGKGGLIRTKARQWLCAMQRNGKLKSVVFGEDFNLFNFKALELKNTYKELEYLLKINNPGVTVVEL